MGTFLALTLLSSLLANVSAPLWTAWITDLVPEDNRGRYFGRKNMYGGWVGMIVPVLGGYFLDAATKRHGMSESLAFAVIFASASLFAFGSFGLGSQSPDVMPAVRDAAEPPEGALAYYRAPFADGNFRRIIAYVAAMVVAQSIAGSVLYSLPDSVPRPGFHRLAAPGRCRRPGVACVHAPLGLPRRQVRQQADPDHLLRVGAAPAVYVASRCS